MQADGRWEQCKAELALRIAAEDAAAWLPGLELLSLDGERAVLGGVANSFYRSRIQSRYRQALLEVLARAYPEVLTGGPPAHLECQLTPAQPAPPRPQQQELPLPPEPVLPVPGLDPRLTLDSLLEGAGNREALELARAVLAQPGTRYNPFTVWGASGLGKTHLLQGLAAALARRHPGLRVQYFSAEAYKVEVLEAIQARRMKPLRDRTRAADALLVDDLQFLLVAPKAQEELLHSFDVLRAAGKQLVFAAQALPRALTGLNETLRSRLEAGLIAELRPPDAALRLAYLQSRVRQEGLALPEAELEGLAQRIGGSLRQVEGALVRLVAYAALQDRPIDHAFVLEVAAPFFTTPEQPAPVLVEDVLAAVCKRLDLNLKALRSPQKTAALVKGRQVAVLLLKELAGLSYREISAHLGGRAPSTLSREARALQAEQLRSPHVGRLLQQLREELWAQAPGQPGRRQRA